MTYSKSNAGSGMTRWNTTGWVNAGAELRRWKRMDVPQFVRHRARVLVQDLLRWTPPRGKHPGSEGWKSMERRGIKTLTWDVNTVFSAVDKLGLWKSPTNKKLGRALKKAVATRDVNWVRRILEESGLKVNSVYPIPYPSIHEKARIYRGRVGKTNLNNWVFHARDINKYIEQRKKKIGEFKSGWGDAAAWLGVPPANWPAWVSRNGLGGSHLDKTQVADKPTITLINDRKAAKDASHAEIVESAIIINENKMIKELQAILRHQARKFNHGRMAA